MSPLALIDQPSINMIRQFILDPMHTYYLGCAKRILKYLIKPLGYKARVTDTHKKTIVHETAEKNKQTQELKKSKRFNSKARAAAAKKKQLKKKQLKRLNIKARLVPPKNKNWLEELQN